MTMEHPREDDRPGAITPGPDAYMRSVAVDVIAARRVLEFARDNRLLAEEYDAFGEDEHDNLLLQGMRDTVTAFLHLARELGADPLHELLLALVNFYWEKTGSAAEVDFAAAKLLGRPWPPEQWPSAEWRARR